jgi:hypothetical protein
MRCADPTELLTFFGALKCKANDGQCTGNVLSTDPLDDDAAWACDVDGCDFRLSAQEVTEVIMNHVHFF